MKYALVVFVLLFASLSIAADRYTIRENHPYRTPNFNQSGKVVERLESDTWVVREVTTGTGWSNNLKRGTGIQDHHDGSYMVREQAIPGIA